MQLDLSTTLVRLGFFALVAGFVFLIVSGVTALLAPFAISFLIAFLLVPFVNWTEGLGIPRAAAVLVALSLLGGSFFLASYTIVPALKEEVDFLREPVLADIETYGAIAPALRAELEALEAESEAPSAAPEAAPPITVSVENEAGTVTVMRIEKIVLDLVVQIRTDMGDTLPETVMRNLNPWQMLARVRRTGMAILPGDFSFIGDLVTSLLITPVILVVFLLQGDQIFKRILAMVPNRYFEMTLSLMHSIHAQIIAYLKGLGLQWLIFGSVLSVGLLIAELPYAIAIAFLAATMNVIPYVGPALGAIPAVLIALVDPSCSIASVLLAFGAAQLIDNVFTQPVILAGSVQLHPLIAILTLITLQQYMGVVGMIIAIPAASIIMVSIEIMYRQMKAFGII